MKRYPILFGLRDLIEGNGYLAAVATDGRALLHEEDDGSVWVEAVNPGGFAGTGNNPAEALESFRREYKAALYDMAEEARSCDDFRARVQAFFENQGEIPARDWAEAVEDVRKGRVEADWMNRRPADSALGVRVFEVEQPSARHNLLEVGAALAA
jgi:hypothetical protein